MKRFTSLLSIFILFLFISCSFTNNSNTVVLTLPSYNVSRAAEEEVPAEVSEETEPEKPVVFNFEITLTDSDSVVQNKSAKSGEEILFSEVPVGTAAISIIAYNEENVACYSGNLTFEVVEGENQITIPVKKLITEDEENSDEDTDKETSEETPEPEPTPELFNIIINFPNSVTRYGISKETFSATEFLDYLKTQTGVSTSSYKQLLVFYNNSELDLSNADAVATFTSELNSSTELTVKAAVKLSDYSNYLSSDEVQANETIYFIQDNTSIIEIPANPSSKSANATGLTLDFSDCNSITKISTSAYSQTGADNRWVKELYLPKSIQYIQGIAGVITAVYIPLTSNDFHFTTNATNSNSTFGIYFDGSLGDWCGRATHINNTDGSSNNPVRYLSSFYIKKDGTYYNILGQDITIDSSYYLNGTNNLTKIPSYIFRYLNCSTITIPGTVDTIESNAFTSCNATEIVIEESDTSLSINQEAFSNMTFLTDVWIKRSEFVDCYSDSFTGCTGGVTVHVPQNLLSNYQGDTVWPNISDITLEGYTE